MPLLKCTCVKGATNHVDMSSRTPATRRVATSWPELRARSPTFESPVWNAIGTLEATVFLEPQAINIQQKNLCVCA